MEGKSGELYRIPLPASDARDSRQLGQPAVSLLVEVTQSVLGVIRRGNLVRGNLRSGQPGYGNPVASRGAVMRLIRPS